MTWWWRRPPRREPPRRRAASPPRNRSVSDSHSPPRLGGSLALLQLRNHTVDFLVGDHVSESHQNLPLAYERIPRMRHEHIVEGNHVSVLPLKAHRVFLIG